MNVSQEIERERECGSQTRTEVIMGSAFFLRLFTEIGEFDISNMLDCLFVPT